MSKPATPNQAVGSEKTNKTTDGSDGWKVEVRLRPILPTPQQDVPEAAATATKAATVTAETEVAAEAAATAEDTTETAVAAEAAAEDVALAATRTAATTAEEAAAAATRATNGVRGNAST